jgi:hypothetical protein
MRFYKDLFSMIFFFSPSAKLDPQYKPLLDYIEKLSPDYKSPRVFEDFNQAQVGAVLDEQRAIVEQCRKRKIKPPQILIILDDLADQESVMRSRKGGQDGGSWLVSLAVRGRHFCTSFFITTQALNLVGPIIRKNVRTILVWRLRNAKEIECLVEEMSGVYPKDVILAMYMHATAEPYSFLTIRLDAKTREDMFWLRFEKRLLPTNEHGLADSTGSVPAEQRPGSAPAGRKKPPAKATGSRDEASDSD